MVEWVPKSRKGSVAQYLAPALVFVAAAVIYTVLVVVNL